MKEEKLAGKVAVITGASRGLGLAIARLYARQGARVVLAARSGNELEQGAAALRAEGWQALAYPCDVTDIEQVEALKRFAINQFGALDIWVNNAAIAGPYGATMDLSPGQFLLVLQVNLNGSYHGSVIAMDHFLKCGRGKLINIVGAGSKRPAANQNAYGSSKAWVRIFSLALARETRESGVGVFTLQPGLMETDLLTDIVTFEKNEKRLRAFMPILIRAGAKKPEIAARKALWLASAATDGRTGLEVRVGSSQAFLAGFLREAVRTLLRLPGRPVRLNIKIIPPASEQENHPSPG